MKKNDFDFSIPTRQSYAAILIISYRLYRIILKQLFPVFIIFFLQGSIGKSKIFLISIIGLASVGAIYSIIAFFRYYFFIDGEKLIVKKGVFKRSVLEIPFDRIQSINFEQNLIHRVFKVVKLNMDTAGSASDELQLYALDKEMADALSQKILESRQSQPADILDNKLNEQQQKQEIFKLSLPQLLKVGISENHLRSGGIIIFFFIWIYDNLREVGLDYKEKLESYIPMAEEMTQSMIMLLAFIVIFFLVSFVISLIRTVLRYYNLRMSRVGDGFSIEKGLINKKEQAAKDIKIQIFRWSQNALQRVADIYELHMRQAASAESRKGKSFKVVGLTKTDVNNTSRYIFKEHLQEFEHVPVQKVDFYYLFKRLYYWTLFCLPPIFFFGIFDQIDLAIYVSIFYAFGLIRSYLSYKKIGFALGDNMIMLKGGTFGHNTTMMMNYKVQNIKVMNTPFQRRRKLSSVAVFTASGVITIPDIKSSLAEKIQDFLIYKVEKSGGEWM